LKYERRFSVLFLIYLTVSGIYILKKKLGIKREMTAGVALKANLISAHFADERSKKVMQIVVKCKST
jgi:hypothetical protein